MQGRATVSLGGKTIHVRETARGMGLDPSTVSKILSGAQDPDRLRVDRASLFVRYLEFPSIEDFVGAVKARRDGREDALPLTTSRRA